ncbi:TetR family transcriptional regulator [Actinokineospora enzanensis]|uniref:acyl-CoA-like ligand-binding transcription factor n=1 Tax=Actinokineospora enzanensis TaxID=155975 RepID=UPI000378E6F4|nr:TetR family transcriptional regulator [Actinokineospora enzanensis]
MGLRELKKEQTREALSWAAIRLTVERGFDAVLVEDIAAAVGVSPRTFNNYFSGKAEAIAARNLDRGKRIVAALRARPADEPLWQAIAEAVATGFMTMPTGTFTESPHWHAGVKLMMQHPALQGEALRANAIVDGAMAVVIAERTGTDPEQMYPQLIARTVGAAVLVAMEQWWRADSSASFEPFLREAIQQLANGLTAP